MLAVSSCFAPFILVCFSKNDMKNFCLLINKVIKKFKLYNVIKIILFIEIHIKSVYNNVEGLNTINNRRGNHRNTKRRIAM